MKKVYKLQRRIMKHLGVWDEFKANQPMRHCVLAASFDWSESSQGFNYWNDIDKKMDQYMGLISEVAIYSAEAARYLKKGIFKEVDPIHISITGRLTDVVPWHLTSMKSGAWAEICESLPKKYR